MADFLDRYKPQITLSELIVVDETLPENELAYTLLKNLVVTKKIQDVSFMVMGKILKTIRDKKLYKYLDYDDFSQFLASEEVSFSREKAYGTIKVYELFVEKLEFSPDEIGKLGIARLMMLTPVIKDLETKEEAVQKIEEMKDLRYPDFVREIKQHTNTDGMPEVFWSEAVGKWFVNYHSNITELHDLGEFNG